MNRQVKEVLIFWLNYGKFTTVVLPALFFMLMCSEAKAQVYKVNWIAETKIADQPANISLIGEGAFTFSYLCETSQVELLAGDVVGEYRAMYCGEHQEYMILVTCLLDGDVRPLTSPTASVMMFVWDQQKKQRFPVYLTLRCIVSSEPDDDNRVLTSL